MNDELKRENKLLNRMAAMLLILIAMMIVSLGGIAMLLIRHMQ